MFAAPPPEEFNVDTKTGTITKVSDCGGDVTDTYNIGATDKKGEFTSTQTIAIDRPADCVGENINTFRIEETANSTTSTFNIPGTKITGFILEPGGPSTSASGKDQRIPEGTYNVNYHNTKKHPDSYVLSNDQVSQDRAILIHPGNTGVDTDGCLLPGGTKAAGSVGGSKAKTKEIYDNIKVKKPENVQVNINNVISLKPDEKNRAVLALMVLLFFIHEITCKGQINNIQEKNRNTKQIDALKGDFNKAQGKDSVQYAKMFFDAFPTDFVSFNSIYGYSDKVGPMPLYSLYEKHIGLFCKLYSSQPTTEHFSKLIKLGINGHWDADAVNALQDCILNHVNEKPGLTVALLKHFKDKEIRSFWRFLFDGPHPDGKEVKKQYDILYKSIGLIDKSMANLIQNEYMKLVQSSSKE